MIKAIAHDGRGRSILVIGLEFGNLDRFRAEPGDTYIRIDGKEVGIGLDVMIFSGETKADLVKTIQNGIGPNTKIMGDPNP
jgi:hypothetical protein